MSDTSLSQLAADLSRLHILLSLADGEPDEDAATFRTLKLTEEVTVTLACSAWRLVQKAHRNARTAR